MRVSPGAMSWLQRLAARDTFLFRLQSLMPWIERLILAPPRLAA